MKAALWLCFQHGIIEYIGVCSFQWKAALLMRTPHSPAVSACRYFGIPVIGKQDGDSKEGTRKLGMSEQARGCFHADRRMNFLEEGGTSSQPFFYVSNTI